jgi:cobalt-precorrin 5A hydrolase
MEREEAMTGIVAAGLGCRKGCPAEEIVALVRLAMERAELSMEVLSGLFAPAFKHGETGLGEAARALGVPLVLIPEPVMKAAEPRAVTRSERVIALTGLASIAETAALAGAGLSSHLVQPRIASRNVTCAIAASDRRNPPE